VVICTKTNDCKNAPDRKRCKCETIHCKLEVRQTEGSAILAKEQEDAAAKSLYQLVQKAMTAMKLDFAYNEF